MSSFSITVNSSDILDFSEFCGKYSKSADSFTAPCERYLEVNIKISNLSDNDCEFPFLPLILKGDDWWCKYSYEETGFANDSVHLNSYYGSITSIDIKKYEAVNVNLVYGLFCDMFTKERWINIDRENKYLAVTCFHSEQKVKL